MAVIAFGGSGRTFFGANISFILIKGGVCMGMAHQGCCEPTLGTSGANWIWILVILFCCGAFGNQGMNLGNILGGGGMRGDCTWIWILIALYCCCCRGRGC